MCSIVSDVNECLLPDACSSDLVCKNTNGSYRCDCPPGFSQNSSSQNDLNPVCNGEKLKVTLLMLCTRARAVAGVGESQPLLRVCSSCLFSSKLLRSGGWGGGGGVSGVNTSNTHAITRCPRMLR